MNQRQGERRIFFSHIFAQMPLWEHWTIALEAFDPVTGFYVDPKMLTSTDVVTKVKKDFKLIPRRLRRQMARVRARREWRVAKGLDAPETQHPPHITELPNSMYVNSQEYKG